MPSIKSFTNCVATSNSVELMLADSSIINTMSAIYPRQLCGVGIEVCPTKATFDIKNSLSQINQTGVIVGDRVGVVDGDAVGKAEGDKVGADVGLDVGVAVGEIEGLAVGLAVGVAN